ncbi:MAG: aldo/keto reductase [Eubacterium sp.]|nr:aldo/keto reductase [Eubacterium sp.]
MNYRDDKKGEKLSLLGYGCMRFTKKGNSIDLDKAEKELMRAIELGVNYFDTAYIYSGSEVAVGEIFERNHVREKVKIATKLPQYMIRNRAAIDKYYNEELQRLRTDYIDYYLMHMLTDTVAWENLVKLGIKEWIADKKARGEIRNVGFSYHGDTKMFKQIIDAYDWDFCQIQYNYLDETTQAGVEGLKYAASKGIPVVIMEPLRGGKLVNLPKEAMGLIEKSSKGWSSAELGLRWLWNQPEVTVVLSGMNSIEMVEENCRIAGNTEPDSFDDADYELVEKIKKILLEKTKVGCTGCRYCMPCPKGVDIPAIFACYNNMFSDGKTEARFEFARLVGVRKEPAFASQCIECGKCEMHCPQHIEIRKKLKEADKALRPLPYKVGINIARKFMLDGRKTK